MSTSLRRPINSRGRNINAQILRGMWTSHTSPSINPRISDNRTPESNKRTDGKTLSNHKNNSEMQIKRPLSCISK